MTDAVFALAVGVVTIAGSVAAGRDQTDMTPIDSTAYVLLVIGALALVARRKLPGLALAGTFACTVAWIYLSYPYGPIFFYVMIAIYSMAAWSRTRYAVIAVALLLLAHIPWSLWGETEPDSLTFAAVTTALWLLCPLAMGIAVRSQRHAIARALEEERSRHIYQERLRLAQEVHDVVGHSLAVISMNAGAALHVLSKQPGPERVAESLRAIRTASSGALDELRSALLHGDGPGLAALPSLLAATRVDGLTTELTVTGERAGIPSTVDLTGYRIVQESLTNVVRHAGAKRACVTVAYQPGRVSLSVLDDGAGGPIGPGGSGLASMAARAQALGGSVQAGPGRSGFEVKAVLPYEIAAA
ncbi:two-component sensor histidine kinase [Rhizocola hellebori]|uniref:histidine kinase n=1 Tax=Rhizocola hellebori TaxID=1392758 RepID=A0A8J3QI24_9ACTN|nr:two-component sensor histidine kinase [Rhizocola hellebori]